MEREEYFFDTEKDTGQEKVFILIIYDIIDNSKRVRFAKFLQGYGNRVQKSAFEARITRKKYNKLITEIPTYVSSADSVRIYKLSGRGQVLSWGTQQEYEQDDIIIV